MKKKITFETASEELDQILRELSQEETTLDRNCMHRLRSWSHFAMKHLPMRR